MKTTTNTIKYRPSQPRAGSRAWVKSLQGEWNWTIQSHKNCTDAVIICCGDKAVARIELDEDGDVKSGNNNLSSFQYVGLLIGEAAYGDLLEWAERNADLIKTEYAAHDDAMHNIFAAAS